MEPLSGVTVRDNALYFDDVLVIADLHIGRGATSNVEFPVGDGDDMVERFDSLCTEFEPAEVIIAGDFLHSFDRVPDTVTGTVAGFERVAAEHAATLLVTPGNHDTLLDVVWSGETASEYRRGETIICHGHVEPSPGADRYIIGHDHPTIKIEGVRRPCYLVGQDCYRGSDLIVLPAFNRLVPGVRINDMRASDFMSPLILNLDSLAPVVRDPDAGETLQFPPLGKFRDRL